MTSDKNITKNAGKGKSQAENTRTSPLEKKNYAVERKMPDKNAGK